ncbi:hypothetical protein L0128_08065 [candidate division KSB1 bacterium]|nr:hypothetical protein [candidate division KSB1 bacterium]
MALQGDGAFLRKGRAASSTAKKRACVSFGYNWDNREGRAMTWITGLFFGADSQLAINKSMRMLAGIFMNSLKTEDSYPNGVKERSKKPEI